MQPQQQFFLKKIVPTYHPANHFSLIRVVDTASRYSEENIFVFSLVILYWVTSHSETVQPEL